MRVMGILVALTLLAFATNCKALGLLILLFLLGCSLFGIAETVKDALDGGLSVEAQRMRLWRDNPEAVMQDFEAWKEQREECRRSRPGYAQRKKELDELVLKLSTSKEIQ